MRDRFLEAFETYLLASIVTAAVIVVFALASKRAWRMRDLQLTFIPLFSILLLTATSLAGLLPLDNKLVLLFLFILYVCAAMLISETLFISDNTVRTHIRNIYRKLGIGSREDILRITRM